MSYQINRSTVEVSLQIEEQFRNASKGDYQYKLATMSPIIRFAFEHEPPEVNPSANFKCIRKKSEIPKTKLSKRAKRVLRATQKRGLGVVSI